MTNTTYTAHLVRRPPAVALAHLHELLAPHVRLTLGPDLPDQPDYHVLIDGRPQRDWLTASRNLQALIIPWAGLPPETRELLIDFPQVAVHNLHHNAGPVAEMTLALLLAAAKAIVPVDRKLRNNDWTPRYELNTSLLLAGKTALILGYGAIGRILAPLCRALGMRVLATRRALSAPIVADGVTIYPPAALPELLPQTHALLVCLPLTDATHGLIGAAELALLPPDAVLVNIGRGPIIDQHALYAALREGRLRAAALDVWYNYPQEEPERSNTPPADVPFHKLDNVVLSPHRAGMLGNVEMELLRMAELARVVNALASGEPAPNRVDLELGY